MWIDHWTTAHYTLHLTDAEFYAMTPRKFIALMKLHRARVEHDEFMFGQLTQWVANTGFRTTEEPTKARDFMPSTWDRKAPTQAPTEMTAERRAAIATAFRNFFAPNR